MERVRFCTPPPHFSEHAAYLDQPDTLQSTGQEKLLQVELALSVGQAVPPCATFVTIERVLVFEPVPHDLVHAP